MTRLRRSTWVAPAGNRKMDCAESAGNRGPRSLEDAAARPAEGQIASALLPLAAFALYWGSSFVIVADNRQYLFGRIHSSMQVWRAKTPQQALAAISTSTALHDSIRPPRHWPWRG